MYFRSNELITITKISNSLIMGNIILKLHNTKGKKKLYSVVLAHCAQQEIWVEHGSQPRVVLSLAQCNIVTCHAWPRCRVIVLVRPPGPIDHGGPPPLRSTLCAGRFVPPWCRAERSLKQRPRPYYCDFICSHADDGGSMRREIARVWGWGAMTSFAVTLATVVRWEREVTSGKDERERKVFGNFLFEHFYHVITYIIMTYFVVVF